MYINFRNYITVLREIFGRKRFGNIRKGYYFCIEFFLTSQRNCSLSRVTML